MKAYTTDNSTSSRIQIATTGFSLAWLFMANLVGLLLASLLLWPELNRFISPLTYGRWIPLHLDWQLYGWCFLPLLGLICTHFFDHQSKGSQSVILCLSLWSLGLLFGGYTWLSGGATGKVFLNWNTSSGLVFTLAQLTIWSLLARAFYERFKNRHQLKESTISLTIKAIALLALICVPAVLLFTSDPSVYPPINPESGGATGHSLLLSTLSLVLLMGVLPGWILTLEPANTRSLKKASRYFWGFFAASIVIFLIIDHGNASNSSFNQIFGLGTLLAWPFLVFKLWSSYSWSMTSNYWRRAFVFWWLLLAIDGWVIFLPGVLDTVKFTNVLVAHSHLAMGGMVSALNMIILIHMSGCDLIRVTLSRKLPFYLWNGGCLLYVVVMTLQGWREGESPQVLFGYDGLTSITYHIRLLAGVSMIAANGLWLQAWAMAFCFSRSSKYTTSSSQTTPVLDHA